LNFATVLSGAQKLHTLTTVQSWNPSPTNNSRVCDRCNAMVGYRKRIDSRLVPRKENDGTTKANHLSISDAME